MSEFKVPKVACLSARLACLQTTKANLNFQSSWWETLRNLTSKANASSTRNVNKIQYKIISSLL